MDRAREFHYVKQMPRRSAGEVDAQDATMDRQVLLNESWPHFCERTGRHGEEADEHAKWVTETWAEYLKRAVRRAEYMDDYAAQQDAVARANAHRDNERKAASDRTVASLMKGDDGRVAATRLGVKHSLLLDFDDLRADREQRERADLEALETKHRALDVVDPEREARNALRVQFTQELNAILVEMERRRLASEAEAERTRQEKQRREAAAREAEERRKRDAEEAERKKREAEEEAKRAERRRKDEERRAKAKADRDAARGGLGGTVTNISFSSTLNKSDDGDRRAVFDATAVAREAREQRMNDGLAKYAEAFEAEAAKASSLDAALLLAERLARETCGSGGVLFHTSLYVALLPSTAEGTDRKADPADSMRIVFASSNSSDALKSGTVVIDGRAKPSLPATL
jgi:hypothetical protein